MRFISVEGKVLLERPALKPSYQNAQRKCQLTSGKFLLLTSLDGLISLFTQHNFFGRHETVDPLCVKMVSDQVLKSRFTIHLTKEHRQ